MDMFQWSMFIFHDCGLLCVVLAGQQSLMHISISILTIIVAITVGWRFGAVQYAVTEAAYNPKCEPTDDTP